MSSKIPDFGRDFEYVGVVNYGPLVALVSFHADVNVISNSKEKPLLSLTYYLWTLLSFDES